MSPNSRSFVTALAVATGGAVGAALRYQLWRWWPTDNQEFPLTTFAINTVGCFLFGICHGSVAGNKRDSATVGRAFLAYGLLGGFTTFSFFAVQGVTLISPRLGMVYLLATPAASVGAAWIGIRTASTVTRRIRHDRKRAR